MKDSVTPLSSFLEAERGNHKQGMLIIALASLLTVLFSLPFIPWMGVYVSALPEAADGISGGYSIFTILNFVRAADFGAIGFFAMILLLLAGGGVLIHFLVLIRVAAKKYGEHGILGFYTLAQAGMLLSIVASIAMFIYVPTSNSAIGGSGLMITFVPIIVLLVNLCGYVAVKNMESRERRIQHEHGFIEEFRRNWILFLFLLPCFIYFMINSYLPMAGVYFAFTRFNFRDGLFASPFVGFDNFIFLIRSDLLKLTSNTVLYNIVFIGVGNILQIFFAILVSRVGSKWFKKLSQTLIFMPYFVSFVILRVLVYNLLEYNVGLVNGIITSMGGEKIDFYNTPGYWPVFITLFQTWKSLGYGMVVYLATIVGISEEYYEAAKVDGASILQQIRYITLPHLKPTFIILILFALGGIMKGQFELFYQIVGNNGVLYNVTDIIDTYVYRITTTQPLAMGEGAAAGLYQSVFGFVIIMVTNFIIKKKSDEYALF